MNLMKKRCGRLLALTLSAAVAFSAGMMGLSPAASAADRKTIQILGTSDLHGRFDAFAYASNTPNTAGGLTQISNKVKELRKQNPNTLLVDAGDTVQDNMADIFLKDEKHPMFVAMDKMDYDTWTVGNHEFNYGADMVEKLVQQPKADVLCGNVYIRDGSRLGKPYTIKEVDGVRVAVIGMTTPNIMRWDGPKLTGYKVTDPVMETRKAIDELKEAKAADIFIAVVHMGVENEYGSNDSAADLAKACPELSAIVAGHAHSNVPSQKVNNTVITEPGKFGENLSRIVLTVEREDGAFRVAGATAETISMKDAPADAELDALLKPWHDRAVAYGNEQIGKLTGGALTPAADFPGITQAQVQDTALMHLILDTQMYYTRQYVPQGAHFVSSAALLDVKANIQEGPIKRCDMVNIYKYDNTLYTMKINGAQLKRYMEWSASYYNQYQPGDLTVSFQDGTPSYLYDTFAGVQYEINIAKPAGSRIENLKYPDGTAVKDGDTVYLTSNDYRSSSKLIGDLFKNENVEVVHRTMDDTTGAVRDMIAAYIQEVKGGTISNAFTPNWKLTGYSFDAEKRALAAKLVRAGTLKIPASDNGKDHNVKSLTDKDVAPYLSQAPKPVCRDASGNVITPGSTISVKRGGVLRFSVEYPLSPSFTVGDGATVKTATARQFDGSKVEFAALGAGKANEKTGVYLDGTRVFDIRVAA